MRLKSWRSSTSHNPLNYFADHKSIKMKQTKKTGKPGLLLGDLELIAFVPLVAQLCGTARPCNEDIASRHNWKVSVGGGIGDLMEKPMRLPIPIQSWTMKKNLARPQWGLHPRSDGNAAWPAGTANLAFYWIGLCKNQWGQGTGPGWVHQWAPGLPPPHSPANSVGIVLWAQREASPAERMLLKRGFTAMKGCPWSEEQHFKEVSR